MRPFSEYLLESNQTYPYIIKTIVKPDKSFMDALTSALKKYDLIRITKPKDTIPEMNPLDFTNTTATVVYIINIEMGHPISTFAVHDALYKTLNINAGHILVRNPNEPLERYTTKITASKMLNLDADKMGMGLASGYVTDEGMLPPPLVNGDTMFGDAYNKRLLQKFQEMSKPNKTDKKSSKKQYHWTVDGLTSDFDNDHGDGSIVAAGSWVSKTFANSDGSEIAWMTNKPKAKK